MKNPQAPTTALGEMAKHIWLAGLGMVATLEKQGEALFSSARETGQTLLNRGEKLQEETQIFGKDARKQLLDRADGVIKSVESVVDVLLKTIGFTTRGEIDLLTRRIERLQLDIEKLNSKLDPGGETNS